MSLTVFENVLAGVTDAAAYVYPAGWSDAIPECPIVLSGSFRPLHRAHRRLLEVGAKCMDRSGDRPLCFELSVSNVEKPAIAEAEVSERVGQFQQVGDVVILTREATFAGKARVLPGATFVVGYDTAVRLFDDRFYTRAPKSSGSGTVDALREIQALGCNFVVGGRHDAHGDFQTWEDYDCPSEFRGMFTSIPASEFCDAISSSQIRGAATS